MTAARLPIFPLPGAIVFPGLQLPLHIFEPRYRALVSDALVKDRRIAMIPPHRLAIAESGIASRHDVERVAALGADAVLVGSSISAAADPAAAVAALTGVARTRRGG